MAVPCVLRAYTGLAMHHHHYRRHHQKSAMEAQRTLWVPAPRTTSHGMSSPSPLPTMASPSPSMPSPPLAATPPTAYRIGGYSMDDSDSDSSSGMITHLRETRMCMVFGYICLAVRTTSLSICLPWSTPARVM